MRNLPAELATELLSSSIEPALMAELFFDSGTLRLWTGYGELEWNGETFFGGGNFIGVSEITETQEVEAKGIVCTLSGIPSNLIALALGENSRGRRFRLYMTAVNTGQYVATEETPGRVELEDGAGYILLENTMTQEPYRIFSGLMDTIEITDSGDTANLRLTVENALIIGQRAKVRRYTPEEQKKRFPNDKGLDFINQLQDKEVVW